MGVSGQVFKDVLRLLNGFPHTDHPLVFVKLLFEARVLFAHLYFLLADGPCEAVDELPAEDQREGLLVEQIVVFAWDPSLGLGTKGTACHQAVEMKMGLELLIPGMQHADKTYFSSQFFFPKSDQCLRYGLKEHIEHEGFVLQDKWIELMRQGKDTVEIGDGEDFGFSDFQPSLPGYLLTLGAVAVSAGVIQNTLSAAMAATIEMAS